MILLSFIQVCAPIVIFYAHIRHISVQTVKTFLCKLLVMIGFYEQFIKKLIACLCHDPISQIFPNANNLCKNVFMKLQIIYNSANLHNNCFTNSLQTFTHKCYT